MEANNTILSKVKKALFGEEEVTEEVVVSETKSEFVSATLADGTSVEIEPALEVGAAVVVVDAEGNPMAAPDAEHELADGTKIVTVDGIITEIMEAEVEEEAKEEEEEMAEEPEVSEEQKVRKVVESIVKESHFVSEEKVTELTNALKEEFAAQLEIKVNELKESMFNAFEEFSKTEEKAPTRKPAYNFQKENKPKTNIFKK